MDPIKQAEKDDIEGARVDRVSSEDEPEDMTEEIDREDIEIAGRKPDLGETEEDTSEI
jgi:hypothetical protein